jgi:hypothetical protein
MTNKSYIANSINVMLEIEKATGGIITVGLECDGSRAVYIAMNMTNEDEMYSATQDFAYT